MARTALTPGFVRERFAGKFTGAGCVGLTALLPTEQTTTVPSPPRPLAVALWMALVMALLGLVLLQLLLITSACAVFHAQLMAFATYASEFSKSLRKMRAITRSTFGATPLVPCPLFVAPREFQRLRCRARRLSHFPQD